MRPIRYMVMMNLAGLHDCIYELKWNNDLNEYWDIPRDMSYSSKNEREIKQFIFNTRAEARTFLNGAKALQAHILDFMGKK